MKSRYVSGFLCVCLLVAAGDVVGVNSATAVGCNDQDSFQTGCPSASGSITDDGVDLTAERTGGGQKGGQSGTRRPNRPGRGVAVPEPPAPVAVDRSDLAPRDGYTVTPAAHPITLADLINFRPESGFDRMEPNGWMVVGLPTNFYAAVTPQIQSGLLLELPASVRFTPQGYHWNYGDGRAAHLASKGASWEASGLAEFEKTATSHVYQAVGSYAIDLTIDFGAEYRYDGGEWKKIPGSLAVAANRLLAKAGDAKTVLVDRDCTARSSGPGC